jgi:hypothetical protein
MKIMFISFCNPSGNPHQAARAEGDIDQRGVCGDGEGGVVNQERKRRANN